LHLLRTGDMYRCLEGVVSQRDGGKEWGREDQVDGEVGRKRGRGSAQGLHTHRVEREVRGTRYKWARRGELEC
jgi:hypothetical protein